MSLLGQGATAQAAGLFAEAVREDPTAADAWLGLHAAGERQAEALAAMTHHSASFGTLRARLTTPLRSRFQIGEYVTFRLETHRDLWLATQCALMDAGRLDEVWAVLSTAYLDCDETRFVCTRHAFLNRDWQNVLTFSQGIQDAFLRDESQLYVGQALVHQKVLHEALNILGPLPGRLEVGSHFDAEVAYWRGRAYEGLGAGEQALKQFQYAFRCWPRLYDVAERAQAALTEPVAATTSAPSARQTSPAQVAEPETSAQASARTSAETAEQGRSELLAEARAELDGMIGLEPVKRQVRTMIAQLQMAALRVEQGIPSETRPQHFVFAGPPGTGKTTVARIVGKIFAGLGLLERGHVIEAQRVDLVGQHLGHTALKTTAVIDSALDGVLFIDEAYALSNSGYAGGDAFGNEALQVLLKRAEDDRERLVMVLAGYRDEMDQLLSTNPGLSSRFTTRVDFPSYSPDELRQIAATFISQSGSVLSAEAASALDETLERVRDMIDTLGNGRFIRNLCQKAAAQRDLRLAAAAGEGQTLTRDQLIMLQAPDVIIAAMELLDSAVPPADHPR
ncbi:MAG: AAA family ATPase [Streptomycetaceae bacterium]|nr:AAA family ATPase [Streptomycetaceae bacterium]